MDGAGNVVPSLYAATSREAAAFETVFHDIDPRARFKTVRQQTIELRMLSIIAPTKDLVLYPLFAPDLKALGLARTDLIETSKATYLQTALWAQALHGAHPGIPRPGLDLASVRSGGLRDLLWRSGFAGRL
ncbi:RES family NAD+ phosphorylase [Acidocella sp.]|uniref:RES family NAD+ phosphorylase n=1 Tax=Acidocella sp. TaxID=50710 RepID=UPI0038CF61E5